MDDNKETKQVHTSVTEDLIDSLVPICPDCKSSDNIIQDYVQGHMVCKECAIVVGDRMISEGTEWRSFSGDGPSNKSDPNRIGGPESSLVEDVSLSTVIGQESEGGNLGRWQNRGSLKSSHRSLLNAFKKTSKLAGRLSLTQAIVDRSNEIYKRVDDSKELKGRKIESILVACLFIACRQCGVPRTLKELCLVADVKRRDVGRCFSKIKKSKMYKKPNVSTRSKKNEEIKTMQAPTGAKFMDRFCSSLNLPTEVTRAAEYVVEKAAELAIAEGKTPATIAGGAIFLVTQLHPVEKRSLKEISNVTLMAESTIRQSFKQLFELRMDLVPKGYAKEEDIKNLSST